jgi:type II secretory pathway predicted ATPase ExeA
MSLTFEKERETSVSSRVATEKRPNGACTDEQRANVANSELSLLPTLHSRKFFEPFGLTENPFSVTPDPRYLYPSVAHAEARSSLIVGTESGIGFQTLIAPPGMGKTTLLFDLLDHFKAVANTAFLFQIYSDPHDFLTSFARELGVKANGSEMGDLLNAINQMLVNGRKTAKRTILIIDEAQNLKKSVLETIRVLSNFETPSEKLLQIILSGQPQLALKLTSPGLKQLQQRISMMATLRAFTPEETQHYVRHRLAKAGCDGTPLFTPAALRLVHEHSRGVPRDINTICFNSLLLARALREMQIGADAVREVVRDLDLGNVVADAREQVHFRGAREDQPHGPVENDSEDVLAVLPSMTVQPTFPGASSGSGKTLFSAAARAKDLTGADAVAIVLGHRGEMVCRAKVGTIGPHLQSRVNHITGLAGACVRMSSIQRCDDSEIDMRVDGRLCHAQQIRSLIYVPLVKAGTLLGIYGLFSSSRNRFVHLTSDFLEGIAQEIARELGKEAMVSENQIRSSSSRITRHIPAATGSGAASKVMSSADSYSSCLFKRDEPSDSRQQNRFVAPEKSRPHARANSTGLVASPSFSGYAQKLASRQKEVFPITSNIEPLGLGSFTTETRGNQNGRTTDVNVAENHSSSRVLLLAILFVLSSMILVFIIAPQTRRALNSEARTTMRKASFASPARLNSKTTSHPEPWPYLSNFADPSESIAYIKKGKSMASSTSFEKLRTAASAQQVSAEYELAMRYAQGSGVPQNYSEAVRWFERAAEQGSASAQWKLGLAYLNGIGIVRGEAKAAQWIQRAANQGNPLAQVALSQLYLEGRGVEKDLTTSYTWASIASQNLGADQAPNLDLIRSELTQKQLANANRDIAIVAHRVRNRVNRIELQ